ncbi:hypothetical protein [Nocardioides aromaticivorans]|nr:hypothetical protein [Nocardioides aromaticivorans]
MTFTQVAMRAFADSLPPAASTANPDPTLFIGDADPNDPAALVDASWPMSRIRGAADMDGWLQQWLSDAWLTMLFARWEAHYRPAFAAANGVEVDRVVSDVIGDIRHLRNDVVHHGGVASARNAGKCIIMTKFSEGTRIQLQPEDVRTLRSALKVSIKPDDTAR